MANNRISLALAGVILLLLALAWTFWPRAKVDVGQSIQLPPAREVRTVEKIIHQVKYVKVYPDKVKSGLDLPASVASDAKKKVIATGKLDAEDRPYTLSAVLDVESGDAVVYARPDPLPWIGPGRQDAVGVAYGIKNGAPAGRLYAEHDLLRVKALHAGARGTLDTDGDWFAGGYVEYRF